MTIGVVLADDQTLVRAGFSLIIRAEADMEVVGEAADGAEAVELVSRLDPDVVLMDIRMPGIDGIEATRRLVAAQVRTRVLVLTTFDLDEYVYDALEAGASGFMLKDSPPESLVSAIRVVAAGDALLAPSITRNVIEHFLRARSRSSADVPDLSELTAREREVLTLVARGLSNAEIAAALVLGEATVKTHVSRILMKLALRDRAQAVVAAYEAGLVVPKS
jgi:DNA-binding NarL/FixJ family response regulator